MGAKRTRLTGPALAALVIGLALAAMTNDAGAEQRRVVVVKFEGPRPQAKKYRKLVLDIASEIYEVVPYSRFRVARRRMNIGKKLTTKTVSRIGKRIGADALIFGEVDGDKLRLSVREGLTGRLVDKVTFRARGELSEDARETLSDELVDLVDYTDPVGAPRETREEADEAPKATQAAVVPAARPAWAIDMPIASASEKKPSKPSAVRFRGEVGLTGSSRSLQFVFSPDLSDDERPVQMAGAPAAAVAMVGTLDILPLKVSAEFTYERSVGASLSYPDGGQTKELAIAASHLTGRVLHTRDLGGRYTLLGGVGYGQLSYAIKNRPNGLLLPDSRYAYVDIGGGAKIRFRDDRVSLSGDLSYLHVLSSGGITAQTAYGTATARGVRGQLGLEIMASDTSYVRLAVRATQISMAFHGNGALATGLDDSDDVDVSGAADTFLGGLAMVGFHF